MDVAPEENKVFQCLNQDCLRQVCRLCRSKSHIPLACEEIEKDADVEMRVLIEKKLMEALVRTCYNCQRKFFKTEGCNMMTCECGKKMCYICRKPVADYDHFYPEGTKPKPGRECPLFVNNEEVNRKAVEDARQSAKEELEKKHIQLKHDPTKVSSSEQK